MLLNIETNGATNIVINVPVEHLKYSQDVVNLFERNAVFVNKGYNEIKFVKPTSTMVLGEDLKFESSYGTELELIVTGKGSAEFDGFVEATPEAFISMKDAIEKRKAENEKLTKEISYLKMQIANKDEEIETLKNND